jgi:hypothetical protein
VDVAIALSCKDWTISDQGSFGKKIVRKRKKWNIVCHPKDQGGLGFHDLEIKKTEHSLENSYSSF